MTKPRFTAALCRSDGGWVSRHGSALTSQLPAPDHCRHPRWTCTHTGFRPAFRRLESQGLAPDPAGRPGPSASRNRSEDATFVYDHSVAGTPQQNHGSYSAVLRADAYHETFVGGMLLTMANLYTMNGRPLTRRGDDLFTRSENHIGRVQGEKVFGPDGRYVGTLVGDRLCSVPHKQLR